MIEEVARKHTFYTLLCAGFSLYHVLSPSGFTQLSKLRARTNEFLRVRAQCVTHGGLSHAGLIQFTRQQELPTC